MANVNGHRRTAILIVNRQAGPMTSSPFAIPPPGVTMPGLDVSQRPIEAEKRLSMGVTVLLSIDWSAFWSASVRVSNGNWMM